MFELARYEGRRRIRGSILLSAGIAVLATMYVATFPSVVSGIDLDEYARQLPEIFRELFDLTTLNSIEGFLATELYALGWILLLGLYLAYSAAGLIADDVDRGRMDLLLSLPVSRRRVVVEKFASILVPITVVNAAIPPVVYAGTVLVGYPIDPVGLLAVHLLSIPYLLACAGIGMVLSVTVGRAGIAQRGALVAVFALFLFESLTTVAGYGWLGAVAPMRHYQPGAILVEATYNPLGALLLLAGATFLLATSAVIFTRRDVE